MKKIITLLIFICCLFISHIEGCSAFVLKKDSQSFLAKSYDWMIEDGLVIVNKRHIAKQAMGSNRPMEWVSKYGSITFNQMGRELPMGGMNEAGLAIELLWLNGTTYPSPDSRLGVLELQWIQYQLDTAGSIEEVIASDKYLRIESDSKSQIHFMVADKRGNSAGIEFIGGQMVVHTGSEMTTPVLTNNSYRESVEFLKKHQGFGGDKIPAEGFASLDRFVRLATRLQEFSLKGQTADSVSAFHILAGVAHFEEIARERTQWEIIYDLCGNKIHFLTRNHQQIRTIQMGAFDFEGDSPVLVLDMQKKINGNINPHFIPYTYELNRKLIDRVYDQIPFLKRIPEEVRERIARYPESTYYIEPSFSF